MSSGVDGTFCSATWVPHEGPVVVTVFVNVDGERASKGAQVLGFVILERYGSFR